MESYPTLFLIYKNGSFCLNCTKKKKKGYFMVSTYFPTRSLEIWYMQDKWCLYKFPPITTLSTEYLISRQYFICVLQLVTGGIKHILCDSTGRGFLEARTQFSLCFVPFALPFDDFAFIIYHRYEHKYMQHPVSLPTK